MKKKLSFLFFLIILMGCSQHNPQLQYKTDYKQEQNHASDVNKEESPNQNVLKAMSAYACNEGFEIGVGNMHSNDVDSAKIQFKVGGIEAACNEMEKTIKPGQNAKCNLTAAANEIHKIEVFSRPEYWLNVSFGCKYPKLQTQIFAINTTVTEIYNNYQEPVRNVSGFIDWASARNIKLVGTNKSSNDIYYNGFDSEKDSTSVENVEGWWIVEAALKKIPDNVLKAGKDKTIYLSTKRGRSYTFVKTEQTVLRAPPGIIFEQRFSEETVVHEFGHIVDLAGINSKGKSAYPYDIWSYLRQERDRIFRVDIPYNPNATEPPAEFISVYSTANDQENFAEHFAYYALQNDEFRKKTENDSLLKEKYGFFRKNIFNENS